MALVYVNPKKAPITTNINPKKEKKVVTTPVINRKRPADEPLGPNDLSSLLLVFISIKIHLQLNLLINKNYSLLQI